MLWLLLACFVPSDAVERALDPDGDGFGPNEDCGPMDATVYPGANEAWYDGVDQDCSNGGDYDQDGDGFASAMAPDEGGQSGADCDDGDATVYPGAAEVCGDGKVNDCEGSEVSALEKCRWQGPVSLADADLKIVGDDVGGETAFAVSSAGDTDCDGRSDVLIGAYRKENMGGWGSAGAAYLLRSSGSLAQAQKELSLSNADLRLEGNSKDWAGYSVAGVGDIDGDSCSDILIGSPYDDDEDRSDLIVGAYLLYSSGGLATTAAAASLSSADRMLDGGGEIGFSVASAGDVDGDGSIDLLIGGISGDDPERLHGAAYLLLSPDDLPGVGPYDLNHWSVTLLGEAEYDIAGFSVASSGATDLDGDGLSDIVVGAPGQDDAGNGAGAAYLLLTTGALSVVDSHATLGSADLKLTGENTMDLAGNAVAIPGDVNGDGLADVVVGAREHGGTLSYSGAAYLLLSSGSLRTSELTLGLASADVKLLGEGSYDSAGYSVSGAGDLDGDDRADLLVGAIFADGDDASTGAAYLLYSSGALASAPSALNLGAADVKLFGESYSDWAGASVAPAGDINGDGFDDILIGAPYNDGGTGAAFLLFGRSF